MAKIEKMSKITAKIKFYDEEIAGRDSFESESLTKRFLENMKNFLYPAEVDYLAYKMLVEDDVCVMASMTNYQQAVEKYLRFIKLYFYGKECPKSKQGHMYDVIVQDTDLNTVIPDITRKEFVKICNEFSSWRYLDFNSTVTKDLMKMNIVLDQFVYEFWKLLCGSRGFVLMYKTCIISGNPHSFILPRIYQTNGDLRKKYLNLLKRDNQYFEKMEELFKNYKF